MVRSEASYFRAEERRNVSWNLEFIRVLTKDGAAIVGGINWDEAVGYRESGMSPETAVDYYRDPTPLPWATAARV